MMDRPRNGVIMEIEGSEYPAVLGMAAIERWEDVHGGIRRYFGRFEHMTFRQMIDLVRHSLVDGGVSEEDALLITESFETTDLPMIDGVASSLLIACMGAARDDELDGPSGSGDDPKAKGESA